MKLNWAERWVVNNPTRVFQQKIEIKWLKKIIDLKPGALALEVGCGRGAGAKMILSEFRPSHLHILDLDIVMMKKAKKHLSSKTENPVSSLVGNASSLPFSAGVFDAVFGFGFLHHVPDWRSALAEIARVLKSGGIYCIEEIYPALYQNFITRRILLHPAQDRFKSNDLLKALHGKGLVLKDAFEWKKIGMVGAAIKSDH